MTSFLMRCCMRSLMRSNTAGGIQQNYRNLGNQSVLSKPGGCFAIIFLLFEGDGHENENVTASFFHTGQKKYKRAI